MSIRVDAHDDDGDCLIVDINQDKGAYDAAREVETERS